jgi:uncharacterized RDD family membrane protein YckC
MTDSYYILEDGDQKGPYSLDELIDLQPDIHTRVLSPNEGTWADACDVPELNAYFESMGVYFPTGDNLASFGWRFLAFFIVLIVFYILFIIVIEVLISKGLISDLNNLKSINDAQKLPASEKLTLQLLIYGIFIFYNFICEISPLKASLGKRLCKMVLVDADGIAPTIMGSFIRIIVKTMSLFFWGLGYLSIFFTEHKQELHDLAARTYVIKRD